jgi:hypothetical protein
MTVADSPLLPKTIRSTLTAPCRVRSQGLSRRTQRGHRQRSCAGSLGTATVVKGFPASDREFISGQVPSLLQAELDR